MRQLRLLDSDTTNIFRHDCARPRLRDQQCHASTLAATSLGLLGGHLSALAAIPEDLDLITSSSEAVEAGLRTLADLVSSLAERKGLTDMAVSKALYLMRPRFVAISDSYVRTSLGVLDSRIIQSASSPAFYAVRMDRVQRAMRELGQANRVVMNHLDTFANSLPPGGAADGNIPREPHPCGALATTHPGYSPVDRCCYPWCHSAF